MLEKIAVNLMAGVPAVVKPSEYTSFFNGSGGAGYYCFKHST